MRVPTVTVQAVEGDLTTQHVDVIVNAANSSLLGGGGVDGAIHRAAGPGLLAECRRIRRERLPAGLAVGSAVATGGHRLPARWVVHTVGPNWHRGECEESLLAACFASSLTLAADLGAHSVAFPAISAGVYGWEPATVARVGVCAVTEVCRDPERVAGVRLVRFVLRGESACRDFVAALREAGQPVDD